MNVYLEAAKFVSDCGGTFFSCLALERLRATNQQIEQYERTFSPVGGPGFTSSVAQLGEGRKEWRITALCFAAAMHDAGDL